MKSLKAVLRLALVLFACVFSFAASAGDTAKFHLLGFSKNGSFFAFEQYGIQDGSGFPYSEIFVIDVIGDTWVKPSPFRLRKDIEANLGNQSDSVLTETRSENRLAAQTLLREVGIAGKGEIVGFNPRTELNSDPHQMVVAAREHFQMEDERVDLALTQYPLHSAECASYGAETQGFKLTMTRSNGTPLRILNQDSTVPKSRRCPLAYRIERFVTFFPHEAPPVFAVLIQMESFGFEGPDRRYLAITGRL